MESDLQFEGGKLRHLLENLKSIQSFNYRHRPDDTRYLFGVMSHMLKFERNPKGKTLYLVLSLAIKKLYSFPDKRLIEVLKQVSVRK